MGGEKNGREIGGKKTMLDTRGHTATAANFRERFKKVGSRK